MFVWHSKQALLPTKLAPSIRGTSTILRWTVEQEQTTATTPPNPTIKNPSIHPRPVFIRAIDLWLRFRSGLLPPGQLEKSAAKLGRASSKPSVVSSAFPPATGKHGGRDAALRRLRPRPAGGSLWMHPAAFALRARECALKEHESFPPLERGGAGPAGQPYPEQLQIQILKPNIAAFT